MAAFIQDVLRQWPDKRILIVTHVRELIDRTTMSCCSFGLRRLPAFIALA